MYSIRTSEIAMCSRRAIQSAILSSSSARAGGVHRMIEGTKHGLRPSNSRLSFGYCAESTLDQPEESLGG